MKQKNFTITNWIHEVLSLYIEEGDMVIDATAGKGKDTLFLCQKTGLMGKVLAFDIQKDAIDSAQKLIAEQGYSECTEFILDGHEHMDQYADEESASVILFNLGYLPGGNHQLATKKETTMEAIEKGLSILKHGGMMCVCIYSGGDSGFEEKEAVLPFLEQLPAKEYDVIECAFGNKPNNPPMPVLVKKR